MFVANKEFLKYTTLIGKNTEIIDVQINELTDFQKKIGSTDRTIDVIFKEKIVDTSSGASNIIGVCERDFAKWFNYKVVTFCYTEKSKNSEFNLDKCQGGSLLFTVPVSWLLEKVDTDETNDLSTLISWSYDYTHDDGYDLFLKAKSEGVIIDYEIEECEYCSSEEL